MEILGIAFRSGSFRRRNAAVINKFPNTRLEIEIICTIPTNIYCIHFDTIDLPVNFCNEVCSR